MQFWNQPRRRGRISFLIATVSVLIIFQQVRAGTCAPTPGGLVAWWAAEGNPNDNVGSNNGTAPFGIAYAPGKVGQAFNFPGFQGRVIAADNNTSFKLTNALSIELWLNINADGGYVFFRGDDRPGLDPYGLVMGSTSNIQFFITSATDSTAITAPIAYHQWKHVAATWDRLSGDMKLYIDGILLAQTNTAVVPIGDLDPSSGPSIGIGNVGGTFNDFAYNGLIDEVSLYSRALAESEIQTIFNSGSAGKCGLPPAILVQPTNQTVVAGGTANFSVVAAGGVLKYQWRFNGTDLGGATNSGLTLFSVQTNQAGNYSVLVTNSGGYIFSSNALLTVLPPPPCASPSSNLISWWRGESNALDQIGGNNGTLSNNVTFAPGAVGSAFVFDGSGAVVRIGNPLSLQMQDLTMELWVRRSSTTATSLNGNGSGILFGWDNSGYAIFLDPSGHPGISKVGINNVTSSSAITDTNWHHLAVTKSGSTIVFYIDGVSFPAAAYNPGFTFGGNFWLGGLANNNTFLGSVDEPAIYNRPLTASEIAAIYNANVSGKCTTAVAPFLVSQAASLTTTVGANIALTNVAGGSVPLLYQWRFNGTNLAGATSNVLVLNNAQFNQSGTYSVTVTNSAGNAASSNAVLTINYPPAPIRVISTNVASGSLVAVPIVLVANGNENALSFSLTYDTTRLTYSSAAIGNGAPGGTLTLNTSQTNLGRLGVAVSLPPGATFNPSTQQVVRVSFATAVITSSAVSTINFGDLPSPRQLLDNQITALSATYSSGTVTISAAVDYEGDVFPRPAGDKATTLTDWLLMGRYVARLDYPTNAAEYQRADCAPRATLGDGAIRITDWVQSGRFEAGLDPLTPVGGPTNDLVVSGPASSAVRVVTAGSAALLQGQTSTIPITLAAQGNENALGLSLSFDPSLVTFVSASLGNGVSGVTLYVNTNQASVGRIGFALALGAGNAFSAAQTELIRVTFRASPTAAGSFSPGFIDLPVPRETSDIAANSLPTGYANGSISVNLPPSLSISRSSTNIVLTWPLWGTNYSLQEASVSLNPPVPWTNVSASVNLSNNLWTVILPLSSTNKLYRLYFH